MIDVAFRILLHDRAKVAVSVLGVAFSVALVLVQVGLFRGLLANATVTIERADADVWITSRNTPNVDFPHYFPETYVQRVRSVPGVARADDLLVAYVGMQLPTGAEETVLVYGLDSPSTWRLPWDIVEGQPEDLRRGRTMLLDDSATRRCGAFRVGEQRLHAFARGQVSLDGLDPRIQGGGPVRQRAHPPVWQGSGEGRDLRESLEQRLDQRTAQPAAGTRDDREAHCRTSLSLRALRRASAITVP